jgi:hypothetical protein
LTKKYWAIFFTNSSGHPAGEPFLKAWHLKKKFICLHMTNNHTYAHSYYLTWLFTNGSITELLDYFWLEHFNRS